MKKICCILLLYFLPGYAFSTCYSSDISVWPYTHQLSPNSILMIEGFGTSQHVVMGLNKKHRVYLKCGEVNIPLQILKIYKSGYHLAQAILKPTVPLVADKTYSLQIDSLDEYEKKDFQEKDFSWTVTEKADHETPVWQQKPVFQGKQLTYYGCGPAMFVNFCICIHDKSPVLVFARLKALKTENVQEYYVTPDSSRLKIGHGMCSGEFVFRDSADYEISFSLMDASGNTNDTLTNALKFMRPNEEDSKSAEDINYCGCPEASLKKNSDSIDFIILLVVVLPVLGFSLFYTGMQSRRRRK